MSQGPATTPAQVPPLPAAASADYHPAGSQAPAWLKSRQQKLSNKPETSPGIDLSGVAPPLNDQTWARRLLNYSLTSYGLSLLIHLAALFVLSFWFFSTNLPQGLQLFGGLANAPEDQLILDTALSTIDNTPAARIDMAPIDALTQSAVGFDPLDAAASAKEGTGDNPDGEGVAMPSVGVPSFAITKGSFSVWTEPKDPKPRQNYYIIVHVKLPPNQTVYPSSDLTGEVIGTDGYRLIIQRALKEADTPVRIKVKNNGVQLKIFVPGAERLVRDEIRVNSRVLKEKQTIEIEF